jgi:FkbM family methyltransferase
MDEHQISMETPVVEQEVSLPDGRRIRAIQAAEAHLIWRSMTKAGLYSKAAAQLRANDIVIDIGAHVGLAAMYFAGAAPNLTVIAAEAAPRTFSCLRHNLACHVPGSIAVHAAVANSRGTRTFTFYENSPGNSGLYADRDQDDATTRRFLQNVGIDEQTALELTDDLHVPTLLPVTTVTVSDLIDRYGITEIGLLKIDVERAELDVAQGVEDRHWPLIRYLVAEVHADNGRLIALQRLLEARGFKVSTSQDPTLVGTELYDLDAVRAP